MKIAIASDDGQTISAHFGRTRGFVVCEVEGKEIKKQDYRENTFTGHARGLEGADPSVDRHGPILNALKDCQVVISHGMGRRIYDDLKQANIDVYVTEQTGVEKAIELFLKSELDDRPDLSCEQTHECR